MKLIQKFLCTTAGLGLSLGMTLSLSATANTQAEASQSPKVLRYAFQVAETGFDPAQISDTYSMTVTPHIFEALYHYDFLARPVKAKPLTAAAMPEVSADFRTWTIKIQPGIYFTDHPAFKGQKRELIAADYVYSFKRFADPALKSPMWNTVDEWSISGLAALRERALSSKQAFESKKPIEGLQALDRYTLQIRLDQPRPRLLEQLARSDLFGAVAWEVAEQYGRDTMEHPVGTGPYLLKEWRRSSRMVLEKNPGYRERFYDAEPSADDAEGQALAARFKGRRIPMIDRVEIAIIEESQPRWLSFLNREHDLLERLPPDFVNVAIPHGQLAPNLAKQGMKLSRVLAADSAFTFFNMEDPTVGGYSAEKVALRRALSLAIDVEGEIRRVRRGQAIIAQSLVLPHTSGYSASFKSSMGDYSPARANALLDLYGYIDRNGDGWRDMPDGSPLEIEVANQPDALSRQYDELWQRNLKAVRIKVRFMHGKWPEQLKMARAGKLMLWYLGTVATAPDGLPALQRLYGPQTGNQNLARFKHAEFDAIYDRLQLMPDGPEREALFLQAKRIQAALMPVKTHVHRLVSDISQPWLIGYRRPLFRYDFWQYMDIDPSLQPSSR